MSEPNQPPRIPSLEPALARVTEGILAVLDETAPDVRPVGEAALASQASLVRPTVLLAAAEVAAGSVPDAAVALARMVELIHLASVLHEQGLQASDDPKAPILLGDLFLARAMTLLAEHGDPEAVAAVSTITGGLAEGQLLERAYRREPAPDPSVAFGYVHQIHERRRAWFLREAAGLGARAGGASEALEDCLCGAGENIGLLVGFHRELEGGAPSPPLARGLRDAAGEAATEARVALGMAERHEPGAPTEAWARWVSDLEDQVPEVPPAPRAESSR